MEECGGESFQLDGEAGWYRVPIVIAYTAAERVVTGGARMTVLVGGDVQIFTGTAREVYTHTHTHTLTSGVAMLQRDPGTTARSPPYRGLSRLSAQGMVIVGLHVLHSTLLTVLGSRIFQGVSTPSPMGWLDKPLPP